MAATDIDHQPLLDTQQNQLSVELAISDSIDNKALALLASNIAVLIFIGQESFVMEWWGWVVLITPFLVSMFLALRIIRQHNYIGAGTDLDQNPEYLILDKEDLLLQLLADTKQAVAHNKQLNVQRLRMSTWALFVACFGVVALFTVLGVQ